MIETYAISNAREEAAKRNRFLIQPEELLRGEKYALDNNLDVLVLSFAPDSPAIPSIMIWRHGGRRIVLIVATN